MDELRAFLDLLAMLVLDPRTGLLLVLLVVAALIDVRTRRIPNWLTATGMVTGLCVGAVLAPSTTTGFASAAAGLLVGLVVLLPLWFLRVLGAGDVKLVAAVGAFLGPGAVLQAVLIIFVVGGIFALARSVSRGALRQLAINLRFIGVNLLVPGHGMWRSTVAATSLTSVGKLPFAISILVGTATFLVARQFGFL